MQPARSPQAPASALAQAHSEGMYHGLGIGLASGISGTFWMGVLAMVSPAINVVPTFATLALTALAVAGLVSVALLALRRAN